MSIEKIQVAAQNISKKKDKVDIQHLVNYCRVAWDIEINKDLIEPALEDINCFRITRTKFDLTNIDSIYDYVDLDELKSKHSFIYFIGDRDQKVCKIGTSIDPDKRLQELSVGYPYKLELLKKIKGGGRVIESYYHQKFNDYYINKEWFSLTGDLKRFVYG